MYCINCGNKIEKNDTFCSKCGKNVKSETTNTNEVGKDRALASMIIGIISMLVGVFFIPLPIVGLILGLSYKGKCSEKTTGIVLNIISLVLAFITLIFSIIFGFVFGVAVLDKVFNEVEFDGSDFNKEFQETEINEPYNESMWNKYESNRVEEIIDYSSDLKGKWKSYVGDDSYYTFNETNFYYYEDMSDPERDYWEGTYSYSTNKDDLNNLVKNKKYINKIIDEINLDEEFYIIELKPTKIVDDNMIENIDKDDEDEFVRLLFIKKHDDGIEGIFVYPEDEEIEYYYKVK